MVDEVKVYKKAHSQAVQYHQVVGEKHDYYITLDQLNNILKEEQDGRNRYRQ